MNKNPMNCAGEPVTVVMLFDRMGDVENVLVKTRYQPAIVHMAAKSVKAKRAIGEVNGCGFIWLKE